MEDKLMEESTSTSSSPVRSWRTSFSTLRDKVTMSPPAITVIQLLNSLIFSQSETLIAATPNLPAQEVTSDAMYLVELARIITESGGDEDTLHALVQLSNLIQNLSHRISFKMTSSTWIFLLHTVEGMLEIFLAPTSIKRVIPGKIAVLEATKQCLETLRCLLDATQNTFVMSDYEQLLNFLLKTVSFSQAALAPCFSSGVQECTPESGKMILQYHNLWEIQTTTFTMISEVFAKVGTSLPAEHWQSTIDVFRNIMDSLATKGLLVEGNVMNRFYTSLLHCLHLVLINAKGSLQDHVAGFVAALKMFLNYGRNSKSSIVSPLGVDVRPTSLNPQSTESTSGPYRPPHLRKKSQKGMQPKELQTLNIMNHPPASMDCMSSDSDLSDNDGSTKDISDLRSSKARVAAIICIQDLCRSDPKSFTAQWTVLLPSSDVLQERRYEANLMTCLLFDPYLKARIASASTLATMLDAPAPVFLQVAEYNESTKLGSFTALSTSLGQILMQLHRGILYLIKHERSSGFLTSLFKILMLLILCTPYSRMPSQLLPTVILNLHERIVEGFPIRTDQTGLLAIALNCLMAALSISPSSVKVNEMIMVEISTGFNNDRSGSGLLSTLFHYSQPSTSPTVSIEALQALKAMTHNYPDIMVLCWKELSSIICGLLDLPVPEGSSRMGTVNSGHTVGGIGEKVTTTAIKLLDECLRAICGFKGTEDLFDDKLLGNPFTSDYIKVKTISSAPSYGSEGSQAVVSDEHPICSSGSEQWCEAIEKQLSSTLCHSSAMVRSASITCFAGITSSVFFSLPEDKQDCIITYSTNAALDDEVPSVRSAACRAIGVIACFSQVCMSVEILRKFIHAAEVNSHHPLVSVRITASWAMANLCDSLRRCLDRHTSTRCSTELRDCSSMISMLIDCSLRLTRDGDKIKANAVRALGNLSRFVPCSIQDIHDKQEHDANIFSQPTTEGSRWLEKMVQAFLSCVTTGNVKVRWNVCHALSNLFLNETLNLQDIDWAPSVFSILLLLLRDSSNFKIRIQAAAALATPRTILDYGKSYSDVVQGVVHILENVGSDHMYAPSSFKYRVALEKQLMSTVLYVLGLASGAPHHPVHDFLVKKALFLEEWLRVLSSSLGNRIEAEDECTWNQKKQVIYETIQSLVKVYKDGGHDAIALRFDKLVDKLV